MVDVIQLPKDDAPRKSALDGIHLHALDTGDADSNLQLMVANQHVVPSLAYDILAVIPTQFGHNRGYLVVTRDTPESKGC